MTNQITVVDTGSTSTAGQGGQLQITGNPTPSSTVSFPLKIPCGPAATTVVNNFSAMVSGVWTGTLQFECSEDGGSTYTPYDVQLVGLESIVTQITANGIFKGNAAGLTHIRIRAISAMTGTANILLNIGAGLDLQNVIVTNPVAITGTIVVAPNRASTHKNTALTNTLDPIKTSAGSLTSYTFVNKGTDEAWIQFFDLAVVDIILGSTPNKFAVWVPAGGAWDDAFPNPLAFNTAITMVATSTENGSVAPSTSIYAAPIGYI